MNKIERKISTFPLLTQGKTLKNYLDKLIPQIKGKTYFDYNFVTEFTRPNWLKWLISPPITWAELCWAEKIFWLYDWESRNCDDMLTIFLDYLVETGFLGRYDYHGAEYLSIDQLKICKAFLWKTFLNVFKPHGTLKYKAIGSWTKGAIHDEVLSHQFIDENWYFLGVWNWEIIISEEACDFCYDLCGRFVIFQDFKSKILYMKDNITWKIKSLKNRKVWWPNILKFLEYLLDKDKLSININEFAELTRTQIYKTHTSKPEATALSNFTRTFQHILVEDFGIEDWEQYFSIDNGLTLKQNISKKDYCWVKR